MSIFVRVVLEPAHAQEYDGYRVLAGRCPVDIFKETEAGVEVDDAQADECTFCGICSDIAPNGVRVEKLY